MRTVEISSEAVREIEAHGEATYPEECCGFLLGEEDATTRRIARIERAPNRVNASRERRYSIEPSDLIDLEHRLEGGDLRLLGIYHSHPDHPAQPSTFDQEHAWPWYAYLVLGVNSGRAGELGAFELDGEAGAFDRSRLVVVGARSALSPS
ncbi:MAG: Mov34/MPN/PAD-1 family protein [Thermoplasmata archaeon]